MLITIVGSKICYGHSRPELIAYMKRVWDEKVGRFFGCMPHDLRFLYISNEQFVRFKSAGRRHAGGAGKHEGFADRDRDDRSGDPTLDRWDVAPYGELTGRTAPWGGGALTNRDHMTADSSNQMRFAQGTWPGQGGNGAAVKREGLAIAVSGQHHREASWTYGGRTKKTDTPTGSTRSGFGASFPTLSFSIETEAMLKWKSDHVNGNGVRKNTLRVEMVGAYAYMYIAAVKSGFIAASQAHDQQLLNFLEIAIANDDGVAR